MSQDRAQWFAFSSLFRRDPKIEALGERFGADGPFLVVGLFCEAKIQQRGGRVEGSLRGIAHDCFIEGRERAAEIIKAAGETDVIEIETLDARAFVVRITNWSRWQETFRKARSRAENEESGQPRTPPDNSGRERTKTDAAVARTETKTETRTETEQPTTKPVVAPPFLPYLNALRRIAEAKGTSVKPLLVVKACEDFADRDLAAELREFEHWHLHGKGAAKRPKDIVAAWRNWLRRSTPRPATTDPQGVDRSRYDAGTIEVAA